MIKDPADLIEKPLHLLGLHHFEAMIVAALMALLLIVGLALAWRRRSPVA